jgi:general secretion pathway protein G
MEICRDMRWGIAGCGRGFTLLELLVTLTLLSVLATLVIPVAQLQLQRQKEQELRASLKEIRSAIDAYKKASDEGRIRKEVGATGYPKSLHLLVDGVDDLRDPKRRKIYFLRRLPRDPFEDGAYRDDSDTWLKRNYASEPTDPQEGDDVYDIRSRSRLVGLNGVSLSSW